MRRRSSLSTARRAGAVAGVVVAVVGAAGCTDDEPTTATTIARVSAPVASTAPLPPEHAAFCEGMIGLDERTDESSGLDAVDDVIAAYTSLLPVAPAEIAADLAAVLERVQVVRAGGELDDAAAAIADDAAARLSGWVDINCHGVSNNPGPPPTPPQ